MKFVFCEFVYVVDPSFVYTFVSVQPYLVMSLCDDCVTNFSILCCSLVRSKLIIRFKFLTVQIFFVYQYFIKSTTSDIDMLL